MNNISEILLNIYNISEICIVSHGLNDVQNEILDIMAFLTLQKKLKTIREHRNFSIIANEGTDVVSNKEQLSFCLRSVDQNLNAFEDFTGFYQLENTKSHTIVHVIKDILIRMNLSLGN